jgi:hypothetical protein
VQDENNPELAEPRVNLPVAVPDSTLTVKAKRLAGNAKCLNCGTPLQGPFCHYCGQPDKNFLRFFPVLLRELLEDFLDFDSRFMRTMKPLLFKPGKLTRDYLDGRRFRYTPPLRLYIFSSIACFFIAALLAGDAIRINFSDDESDGVVSAVRIGAIDDPELREALDRLDPETRREVDQSLQEVAKAGEGEDAKGENAENQDTININGEPWDRETNPLVVEWLPGWVNDWINNEIEQSPAKGREIAQNPNLIKEKVFDVLPATMFVLLPVVALLFKFWYLFAKKYYIEHLIFALHLHSFLYVVLLISLLATSFADWAEPGGSGRITTAVTWLNAAAGIWVPVYFLVALKRVYRQGWFMTVMKSGLIGISYLLLLSLASAFVALLSFVLL